MVNSENLMISLNEKGNKDTCDKNYELASAENIDISQLATCMKNLEIMPKLVLIEVKPRKEECRCLNCRKFYNFKFDAFYERCLATEIPSFNVCKRVEIPSGDEEKHFNNTTIVVVLLAIFICAVFSFFIYKKHKAAEISNTVSFVIHFLYFQIQENYSNFLNHFFSGSWRRSCFQKRRSNFSRRSRSFVK